MISRLSFFVPQNKFANNPPPPPRDVTYVIDKTVPLFRYENLGSLTWGDITSNLITIVDGSILTNESTDVSNKAILLCYINFIDNNCYDMKELFCCIEMPSQTTCFEILKLLTANLWIGNNVLECI
jgi:hypothetical protein